MAGGALLRPLHAGASESKLRMHAGRPLSRVVQVQNAYAVRGPEVHRAVLDDMLTQALTHLTGASSAPESWRMILHPNDIIGLKFNRSGQEMIATSDPVADVLIASIRDAGWGSERIVCIEAPLGTEERNKTTPAHSGYAATANDFGSGSDQFASVLDQITALIDVPFLKSHNIAGMTCCLKNLSHGLIKHPARYHQNGCSPFIADIVAAPAISKKLRLCLVDALRVVHDGGPAPTGGTITDHGVLLASFDPVATDTVGLAILNDLRRGYDLPPIAVSADKLGYLSAAHHRGLGVALWRGIDLVRIRS